MRAFVTGATGFIGGHLVRALIARGDSVTALVRSPDRATHLKALGVTLVPGDITEPSTLAGPSKKADAMFHLAAWYQLGVSDRTKMYQVNVRGTEHVLRAAAAAGTAKVVYCSSVAVLGRQPLGEIASETTPHPGRFASAYEETKWQAHQRVREMTAEGMPVVSVLPGAVYGPGDPSALGAMIRLYAKGWLVACPSLDGGLSWTPVADLVEGMLAAHDKGRIGEDYILGGENLALRDVFETLEPITGIRAPRFELPRWAVRASLPLSPLIGRALHAGPRIVPDGIDTMAGSWMAFSTKAEHELGYVYRGVAEAMPETVDWCKES